ncbi:MAG: response regulator [Butyrivibrio sp.]|nr:response regulator [Butyrivibrio sp.]
MKKILLIGKMNEITKSLNDYLHEYYRVQLCVQNNADSLIKIIEPDIVIIVLIGIYDIDFGFFDLMKEEYPDTPVITIGTEGEFEKFKSLSKNTQFENLVRPIENEDVFKAIQRKLKTDDEDNYKFESTPVAGKKHVLVIDDNAMVLRSLKSILEPTYRVTLANSGLKGISFISKDRPDVILLDYEMPVCDGKQTMRMLKADADMRKIPIIFLTGVNDREHIEAVLKLKPQGYLLKPVPQKKLIDTLERAMADKSGDSYG